MIFNINKGATLPVMRLELIQDGRYEWNSFFNKLQNSNIYFTMSDLETGVKKIGKKQTVALLKETCPNCDNCLGDEYYLSYTFTERDTNKSGAYVGQFIIEFLDDSGTLIVPLGEELHIHVLGGSIRT
tara:strand:- start:9458 stop:9841 length:384 start_codon:yes stop_codon:yes gene_type:complete